MFDECRKGRGESIGLLNRIGLTGGVAEVNEAIPALSILKQSFWRLVRRFHKGAEKPFGSSTACIVSLVKETGQLDMCNLGDSGYLVIRDGSVIGRSQSQQHRFNSPYQLMLSPEGDISDCTHMSAVTSLQTRPTDMVILASDGLWDNLFEQDILTAIRNTTNSADPQLVAQELVRQAQKASEREDYESPFTWRRVDMASSDWEVK